MSFTKTSSFRLFEPLAIVRKPRTSWPDVQGGTHCRQLFRRRIPYTALRVAITRSTYSRELGAGGRRARMGGASAGADPRHRESVPDAARWRRPDVLLPADLPALDRS
jgi:hypothetical protein